MPMTRTRALCAALVALAWAAPAARAADCRPAPLGEATLYLRGALNNWAAQDEHAFEYRCDAYYLNLKAQGTQEFKLADEDWTPELTFGGDAQGRPARGAPGNLKRDFNGEHTLRLAIAADGLATLAVGPRTFKPTPPRPITDRAALTTHFSSRLDKYKTPFGAQPAGTEISFSIGNDAPGLKHATLVIERRHLAGNQQQLDYEPLARIEMTPHSRGLGVGFSARYRFADVGIYGYWFELEMGDGTRYALQNNTDTVYWTREKGSMGPAVVERLPANAKRIRRYRQTIYAPDFQVPGWAKDVVYYYVFPERFRNGDKGNDPRPGGGRPQDRYQDRDVERHATWNEKPFRPDSGDGSDSLYNNDFFGGDLAGLTTKLDYIQSLGANALYLTPVFRAPSNHKYDAADYKHIDPAFGSDDDFVRLCAEAAKRGMRVIPDTSLNHVGADSPYFNRYGNFPTGGAFDGGKINPASPYASWFKFKPDEKDDRQYQGWAGVSDLPEIDKDSPSFRAYAYRDADSVTRLWLNRGAAGWRMDVAPWVPDDFWREWRQAVKATRPDALTVAETWFDASKYFLGDTFDSTMNYIFRNAVLDYAAGKSGKRMAANLELMREAYPHQAFSALMNLLSTHDQPRALHHLGEDRDPSQAKQRLRLAVFFQMTYPGSPTIYYGDEVGVGGGDDPYNRAPYPWADEGGQPDLALLADFRRLTKLRHDLPVLRHGLLSAPLHVDDQVVVLARQDGKTWAVTATNNSLQARTVQVGLPFAADQLQDALGGGTVAVQGGRLQLTVPPLSGRVLTTSLP